MIMKKMFFISVGMMMLAVTGCNQNKTKEGAVNTDDGPNERGSRGISSD